MKLRWYQEPLLELTKVSLRKYGSTILCAPTGAGKTAMSSFILSNRFEMGKSTYFCVHRRQLIRQVSEALKSQNIDHGIIASKYPYDESKLVQVCMMQTYIRRKIKPAKMLVIDECHLQPDIYKRIIAVNPGALVLGLSATPERLNLKPLDAFRDKIETVTTSELIESGDLCKFKYFAPTQYDFSKVKKIGGDYNEKEVGSIVEKSTLIGDSIEHYIKYGENGRFLNFSYSVSHSIRTAEAFTRAGFPCVHVDGESSEEHRIDAENNIKSGAIRGISNCNLYAEGTDLPALEVLIKQKPTASMMRNRQMDGRVLRNSPGKNYAIIIDMINNYRKHGTPIQPHEWAWKGATRESRESSEKTIGITLCEKCKSAQKSSAIICDNCGAALVHKPKEEIKQKKGELTEVELIIKKQERQEVGRPKTMADLFAIQKARGYKSGWVFYQMRLKGIKS